VKTSELLVIDVAGELRDLCREQLRGSWQVAAEVVRFCLSRGATSIAFQGRRKGFSVRCGGCRRLDNELRDLSAVLSRTDDRAGCHEALVRLEKTEAMALLWMAGIEGASVAVSSRGGGGGSSFHFRPGAGASVEELAAADVDPFLEVIFASPGFDNIRAVRWLRTAVRFSPVVVDVDGSPAARGFEDSLVEIAMKRPLTGRLALAWTGDAPRLWLLQHGVVVTRATVPSYPAFVVAVEMAEVVRPGSTPAEIREAVNPHLREIIDSAVRLMISAGGRVTELIGPARRRLSCLLLRAARTGLRKDEIFELPFLPVRNPGSGDDSLISLRELGEIARGQSGVVVSLPAEEVRGRSPVVPALVLSNEERGLLTDLLNVRLERPPRSGRSGIVRRIVTGSRAVGSWILGRVRGGFRGGVVPDDELLEAERRLLGELNRYAGESLEVRLCAGSGGARRRGGRLLLPRNNPLVAGSVRLTESDGRWLYPVVTALLGERMEADEDLRARWIRQVLRDTEVAR